MSRSRSVLVAGALLALGGLVTGAGRLPPAARGQLAEEDSPVSERDRLFDELQADAAEFEARGNLVKRVVRLAGPSVVHIEAEKQLTGAKGRPRPVEEAGSGVIFQTEGKYYVLTNRHVIKNSVLENIHVNLADGRQISPTKAWMDPDTDIAVMALSAPSLVAARLGDSDNVDIGDFVLAVGSPFGLSRSVTYGIISAKGRNDLELGDDVRFQDFLQTDAAINPGNSGGPLLNLRGEVIGINTAIASSSGGNEGIGFSIPINMVMIVARQLIEHGRVSRAYLGVNLDPKFSPEMAGQVGLDRRRGARITGVTPGSPADAAGLKVGDIILQFGEDKVENDAHLMNIVSLTEVETDIMLMVFRDRKTLEVTVRLGDRSKFENRSYAEPAGEQPKFALDDIDAWNIAELGLTVVGLDVKVARKLKLSGTTGLVVTEVDPAGPTKGRIVPGEVIDQVEQKPVQDIGDLERIMGTFDWRRGLKLHVVPGRSGRHLPRTLLVKPIVNTSAGDER